MYTHSHSNRAQEENRKSTINAPFNNKKKNSSVLQFVDKRPQKINQTKLQRLANTNIHTTQIIQFSGLKHYKINSPKVLQKVPSKKGKGKKIASRPSWIGGAYGDLRDATLKTISKQLYGSSLDVTKGIGEQGAARLHTYPWASIKKRITEGTHPDAIKAEFDQGYHLKQQQLEQGGHSASNGYKKIYEEWNKLYNEHGIDNFKKRDLLFEHPGNVYQIGPQRANGAVNDTFHGNFSNGAYTPTSNKLISFPGAAVVKHHTDEKGRKYDGQGRWHIVTYKKGKAKTGLLHHQKKKGIVADVRLLDSSKMDSIYANRFKVLSSGGTKKGGKKGPFKKTK